MTLPCGPESPIKVAIADEKEQTRRALKAFLSTFRDIEVIAEATTAPDAMAMAQRCHPDVVLMGDLLPPKSSIEATTHIKQCWPEIAVVVMTQHEGLIPEAEAAGADAFLVKGSSSHKLVAMIRRVAWQAGGRVRQEH